MSINTTAAQGSAAATGTAESRNMKPSARNKKPFRATPEYWASEGEKAR